MSTFHLYPHSEVIASSFTDRFEDLLRWLHNNAADKSYLEMIKEIPFQYNLDYPTGNLKFQSELSRIVKHYDSLTIAEDAEAVKILLEKNLYP